MYAVSSNVAGQPAWILDTRAVNPRTFFVPGMVKAVNTDFERAV